MPERKQPSPSTDVALTSFRMPSLGADMDAGTILEWLVAPGATVRRGDVVAVVQTDKSDLDIEMFHDGVIMELVVPVGEKVPVGAVIATLAPIGAGATATPSTAPMTPPTAAPVATKPAATKPAATKPAATKPAPIAPTSEPVAATARAAGAGEAHLHSPVLRHLAETLHVDTTQLRGSGVGGSITRDDIERAGARRRVTPRARRLAGERGLDLAVFAAGTVVTGEQVLRHLAEQPAAAPSPVVARRGPDRDAMRQAIARQMTASWQQIPHYRVTTRIDVHRTMEALDARNLGHAASERILPAAVLLHAVARAAAAVPAVNGHWIDGSFVPGTGVHLGVVVSLRGGGLLAPVIRDADRKDLATLMSDLRDLVTRARSGHLRASEVGTATITVTDLGEGGVDAVSPIIHPPQVAIVGFGAVHAEPWADGSDVVVRSVVCASLAGDHRAIDGRIGSLFLTHLADYLQEPLEP